MNEWMNEGFTLAKEFKLASLAVLLACTIFLSKAIFSDCVELRSKHTSELMALLFFYEKGLVFCFEWEDVPWLMQLIYIYDNMSF